MGVIIVAAAGNFATVRPFYPAAFAPRYTDPHVAPLLSVGALNPNGSVALFSDDGPWVSCFATGAAVVSTSPPPRPAAASPSSLWTPAPAGPGRRRLRSGFAVWSGTSFAAPAVAATLAVALYQGAARVTC